MGDFDHKLGWGSYETFKSRALWLSGFKFL